MSIWKEIWNTIFSPVRRRGNIPPPATDSTVSIDELRQFLPSFLSQGSENAFVDEIRHFLDKGEGRPFYTHACGELPYIFQGDGLDGLPIAKLPELKLQKGKGVIFSNTCDLDPENKRLFSSSICYAPLISLPAYLGALRKVFEKDRVDSHERDLRRQTITQIFFLPKGAALENDAIVFLDQIISIPNQTVNRADLSSQRLFTLSDFGAWLFSLKLSIHFCRIRDKVDRMAGIVG